MPLEHPSRLHFRIAFWSVFICSTVVAYIGQGAVFVVDQAGDSGAGSLRDTILLANESPGLDQIHFRLDNAIIAPFTPLPFITDPLVIDGTTQPGFTSTPLITLDGKNGPAGEGLVLQTSNSVVRGLIIVQFPGSGVFIANGYNNVIEGCWLGLDRSGIRANGHYGVLLNSSAYNLIGGTANHAGNWISGNIHGNIALRGAGAIGNLVQGNVIGPDLSGIRRPPPGFGSGIMLEPGADMNIIGGDVPEARNIIAGHPVTGIGIYSSSNVVQGNWIGFNVFGGPLGNAYDGLAIRGPGGGNIIGGTVAGAANLIAYNGGRGVTLALFTKDNAILGNRIYANGILGIDLGEDRVTRNDRTDGDGGDNQLQNYPAVYVLGAGVVGAYLSSTPNTNFRLEFFWTSECHPSGFGEGYILLGAENVTTDAAGLAATQFSYTDIGWPGFVTATATDSAGNTSEFSACSINGPNQPPRFRMGTDLTIMEDAPTQTVRWATEMTAGSPAEAYQQLSFVVTNDNPALFSLQPTMFPIGLLRYAPSPNAYGTALVTVMLKDDGGAAFGGSDTSAAEAFRITILPANDKPLAYAQALTTTREHRLL
jgi:trimeric autotransporter adhesin